MLALVRWRKPRCSEVPKFLPVKRQRRPAPIPAPCFLITVHSYATRAELLFPDAEGPLALLALQHSSASLFDLELCIGPACGLV